VRGLSRMLEEGRYCIDIITQIGAVRAALKRVEHELLRDHVDYCLREAIEGGTPKDQEQKIEELMSVIARCGP
jgi:CsoR family transcriptional regulator, copper-sensing transcriptional repressor